MMMHFKFEISRQLGTSQQVSAHSTMHIYIISYDERYISVSWSVYSVSIFSLSKCIFFFKNVKKHFLRILNSRSLFTQIIYYYASFVL